MMHDGQENAPFEAQHGHELRNGVRARPQTRAVWMASDLTLSIAGFGAEIVGLPSAFPQGGHVRSRQDPGSTIASVPATPTPIPMVPRLPPPGPAQHPTMPSTSTPK